MTDTHGTTSFREKIRQTMRERRRALSKEARQALSEATCKHVLKHPNWKQVKRLALYWPFDNELDIEALYTTAFAESKHIFLPRIINAANRDMRLLPMRRGQKLVRNPIGFLEPPEANLKYACEPESLDWVILPMLAISNDGVRLGSGGGFYDQLLQPVKQAAKPELITLGYDFQRIQQLYANETDVPVSTLVTETGIHKLP